MPATDALMMHARLIENLGEATYYGLHQTLSEYTQKDHPNDYNARVDRIGPHVLANALRTAETYYVSPQMMELAIRASEDLPEDTTVEKWDLPSDAGCMLFGGKFREYEVRGNLVVYHGVVWLNDHLWWLVDPSDPDDEINRAVMEDALRESNSRLAVLTENYVRWKWIVSAGEWFRFGAPVPQHVGFPKHTLPMDAKLTWTLDETGEKTIMSTDYPIDLTQLEHVMRPSSSLMFILSIWRLMDQTFVDVSEDHKHPKGVKRYAQKTGVKGTGVTVIQLRRRERADYEPTGRHINYQTPVRGHWKRVHYKDEDGEWQVRHVYIHGYWRGPDDAPIIIRKRVNALVR